jgi:hypothetical protein
MHLRSGAERQDTPAQSPLVPSTCPNNTRSIDLDASGTRERIAT